MPLKVHGAGTPFDGVVTTDIFATVPSIPTGLLPLLKWVPSVYTNPQATHITAVDAVTGTPPPTECDRCQTAGAWRTCTQIFPYGTLCYSSDSITPSQELLRLNQGEPDYTLVNVEALVSPEVREIIARGEGLTGEALLQNAVAMAMVAIARQILSTTSNWLWSGDPAGGTEGFKPFPGLDLQIKTGIRDAISGTLCPSMDSIVTDYNDNWNAVDASGSKLANLLSTVMAALEERAVPFGGAKFAIVVPPALKYYIAMAFYGMVAAAGWTTFPTGIQGVIDLTELNSRREGALSRDEIVINGTRYTFIADPQIPVTPDGALRTGNIYVVPLEAAGRPGTYLNYLDYRRSPQLEANPMVITDAGRAMWWLTTSGPCVIVSSRMTPRVVLLFPRLAAKITNVKWQAIQTGIGEPYPGGGRG